VGEAQETQAAERKGQRAGRHSASELAAAVARPDSLHRFVGPSIPAGCNTVQFPFTTQGGARALAVNQTGFVRELKDNEREVNGCLCLGETLGSNQLDDAVLQAVHAELLKS